MKLYDLVKEILSEYPVTRNSDKMLLWTVWGKKGFLHQVVDPYGRWDPYFALKRSAFLDGPTPETITRCRRKIQEKHPELAAESAVEAARREKEKQKGTFIYREEDQKKLL